MWDNKLNLLAEEHADCILSIPKMKNSMQANSCFNIHCTYLSRYTHTHTSVSCSYHFQVQSGLVSCILMQLPCVL